MQPRQIVIIVAAVVVAFGAAFGIGKLGGGSKEAAATAAKPAEVIQPRDATVAADVTAATALPPLQLPAKKKAKKPDSTSTTGTGPAQTTTPQSNTVPRTVVPSTPKSTQPNTTQPQNNDPIQTGGGDN
jgi:hypothetical protein